MKHSCLKCKEAYEDNEEDDYLCAICLVEKKRTAKEIDKKFSTVVRPPKPYDEIEKWKREGGFMPIIR